MVHTDDFATWDKALQWHAVMIERVFAPIAGGATTISYTPTQWWPGNAPAAVDQPVTEVMIIEGVGALRPEFRPFLSCGIFVDVQRDLSTERGIRRDLATGRPRSELQRLWSGWAAEEDRYLGRDQPQTYADIILDGARPFLDQLQL